MSKDWINKVKWQQKCGVHWPQSHREWFALKELSSYSLTILFQHPAKGRDTSHYLRLIQILPNLALDIGRDGAAAAALGGDSDKDQEYQCSIASCSTSSPGELIAQSEQLAGVLSVADDSVLPGTAVTMHFMVL